MTVRAPAPLTGSETFHDPPPETTRAVTPPSKTEGQAAAAKRTAQSYPVWGVVGPNAAAAPRETRREGGHTVPFKRSEDCG